MSICPKNKSSKGRRDKRRANWKMRLKHRFILLKRLCVRKLSMWKYLPKKSLKVVNFEGLQSENCKKMPILKKHC